MISIDLSGKTALVTGGGQGLGAATADVLAQAGANVVINFFNDANGINRRRAEETIERIGPSAMMVEADVRMLDQVEKMVDQIMDRHQRLDIVVNNAAILRDATLKKMSADDWQAVIDTNLTGVYNVCKSVVERLSDGGRIINIGSISAAIGTFGQANYVAAKAGVAGLTKVLGRELARRRITVNAVAPGVVLTEMGRSIPEDMQTEILKSIPLARFGEPEEIARVILFLASDLATYVTGQTIHVNGGWWAC
jgi:3-oxoacyl-[acyl-carrier protein] reductase